MVRLDSAELRDFLLNLKQQKADRQAELATFWKRVAIYLYRVEDQIFRNMGAYGGEKKWPGLKPASIQSRWYRRNKGKSFTIRRGKSGYRLRSGALEFMTSSQPLLDTGVLRASIRVLASDANRLEFGSNLNYAGVHQYGTNRGVPARRFVFVTKQDIDHMEQMALNFFVLEGK